MGLFVKLTVNGLKGGVKHQWSVCRRKNETSDCRAPDDLLQIFRPQEAFYVEHCFRLAWLFILHNIILDFA